MNRQSTEHLQGYSEDTIMDMSLQVCQNPQKVHRVNPDVNCGLCIITMCQRRVIRCHTVPLQWGMLTRGGHCTCVGAEDIHFLLHFAVNLKLL